MCAGRRLLAVALPALVVAAEGAVLAQAIDPTIPRPLVVGAPIGAAPMDRIDSSRSGRTTLPFPVEPSVLRRVRLAADLSVSPAVDERGRLVVATADGTLSQLDAEGRTEWSLELGGRAAQGPVIASSGVRFVITDSREVVGVSEMGRILFRLHFSGRGAGARAAPLATRDGGVVFSAGTDVFRVGAGGTVDASARAGAPAAALLEDGSRLLVTTESGEVLSWRPPRAPRRVGAFGARPTSDVVRTPSGSLQAVVKDSTLVELDLRSGARRSLATAAPDLFLGSLAVAASGEVRLVTRSGFLVGHQGERQTLRLGLGPSGVSLGLGLLLVDGVGTTAFTGAAGLIGVVLPSNDVRTATVEGCGVPLAVLPTGPRRLVVACRTGLVAFIGEAGPSRSGIPPAPGPR